MAELQSFALPTLRCAKRNTNFKKFRRDAIAYADRKGPTDLQAASALLHCLDSRGTNTLANLDPPIKRTADIKVRVRGAAKNEKWVRD